MVWSWCCARYPFIDLGKCEASASSCRAGTTQSTLVLAAAEIQTQSSTTTTTSNTTDSPSQSLVGVACTRAVPTCPLVMPPKGKHRTTGLVNPGKVTKRRSNHNLHDLHANGSAATPPAPVTTLQPNGSLPGPPREEDAAQPALEHSARPSPGLPLEDNAPFPDDDDFPPAPLAMDVHKHSGSTAASPGGSGSGTIAKNMSTLKQLTIATTTILTSCPQRDVIAMLILLLQLSSPVLFVVDFLFAVMTTYLPKLSAPAIVMPSFQALFEGTGGAPSIATVILIDVIFFGLWVFMPIPVKNVGLDLAQAVIALSFSGAASSKSGTTRSAIICLATITLFRTLSHRPTRQLGWHILWTRLLRQPSEMQLPPDPGGGVPFIFLDRPSLPRTIVGVHILAQGVLRVIRRSVLAARDGSAQLASAKKVDPGDRLFEQVHGRGVKQADKSADSSAVSPTDTRAPGTLPITSEAIDRAIAGKRKKKQATLVRSQQPFWAALAHTKVTVSNTMDQNHLSHDASEAHATNLTNIGKANFVTDTDRVWITNVDATEIGFGITLARECVDQRKGDADCESSASMDKSAPFYVRVNGANWSSTLFSELDGAAGHQSDVQSWTGEIFGLTPLYNYVCEFVRTVDDIVVHTANLITQPAPYTEQGKSSSAAAKIPSLTRFSAGTRPPDSASVISDDHPQGINCRGRGKASRSAQQAPSHPQGAQSRHHCCQARSRPAVQRSRHCWRAGRTP